MRLQLTFLPPQKELLEIAFSKAFCTTVQKPWEKSLRQKPFCLTAKSLGKRASGKAKGEKNT